MSETMKYYLYQVFSGVDAFELEKNGEKIYLAYLPVIAKNPEEARKQAAAILDMKLDDQETNPDYENYISEHVELIREW